MQKSATRTFAVRLVCPHCEATSWLTLSNRSESFDEIRRQSWEFKCREHGAQRGKPVELLEVAPIDEPDIETLQKASRPSAYAATSKKSPRSGPRVSLHVPITVYGFGSASGSFKEERKPYSSTQAAHLFFSRQGSPSEIPSLLSIASPERKSRFASPTWTNTPSANAALALLSSSRFPASGAAPARNRAFPNLCASSSRARTPPDARSSNPRSRGPQSGWRTPRWRRTSHFHGPNAGDSPPLAQS